MVFSHPNRGVKVQLSVQLPRLPYSPLPAGLKRRLPLYLTGGPGN